MNGSITFIIWEESCREGESCEESEGNEKRREKAVNGGHGFRVVAEEEGLGFGGEIDDG